MTSGVYTLENLATGQVYVGSTIDFFKREYAHRRELNLGVHRNQHLQKSWIKYGAAAFVFRKWLVCSKEELIQNEQKLIDGIGESWGWSKLLNINPTAGSTLGRKFSEETKRKIGEKSKGRWTGKRHTDATRQKMRESNKGTNTGRKWSEEAKAKMSQQRSGKKFTEEHKERLRQTHLRLSAEKKLNSVPTPAYYRGGSRGPQLNLATAKEIRILFHAGRTRKELSHLFMVSKHSIHRIINNITYTDTANS